MSTQMINGVPVSAVAGLVNALKNDQANGQTKWNAVTTWRGGFASVGRR